MTSILLYSIHLAFRVYTVLLFARVIGSWFPGIAQHKVMRFIGHYTDPYLQLFRRLIPPIGGVLDLSPLLAFFALSLLEHFIIHLFLW
ncbi:MAG: YggT family protein [Chlamydiae bacterium]|nr:YggT family protein [Chlamydiota bacterium]